MSRARRLAVVGALLGALASGWLPGHASAVTGGVVDVPGPTIAPLIVDLDGDGVRDLVRIQDTGQGARLEWWTAGDDGWAARDAVTIVRPDVAQGVGPFRVGRDPIVLFRPRGADGRLLLITGQAVPEDGQTVRARGWWVGVTRGRLVMTDAPGIAPFEQAYLLDVDADGVDELMTFDVDDNAATTIVTTLGRAGDAWREVPGGSIHLAEGYWGGIVGDSDGAPGDEMVGALGSSDLIRIGRGPDGRIGLERVPVRAAVAENETMLWPVVVAAGRIICQTDEGLVQIADWPRDGDVSVRPTATTTTSTWLTRLSDDRLVSVAPSVPGAFNPPNDVTVLDANLNVVKELGRVDSPLVELALESPVLNSTNVPYPYIGPVIGGLDGTSDAFVVNGRLVDVATGEPRLVDVGPLAGVLLIGSAGRGNDTFVVGDTFGPDGRTGALAQYGAGHIHLVPSQMLLDRDAATRPTISAPVESGTPSPVSVAEPGFDATVASPERSKIILIVDTDVVLDGTMPPGTSTVRVEPRITRKGNQIVDSMLLIATPLGELRTAHWRVKVLREPPTLTASAATQLMSFGSTVVGSASKETTITVDGATVPLAADGTFRVTVDAGPWPRDIRVTATDAVGHEASTVVSVIGFLDYRIVPWPVLVILMTILIGAVLYATAPRLRPPEARLAGGAALLEEIDGEPVNLLPRPGSGYHRSSQRSPDERPSD